jgi:hypothetical protein
MPSLPLMSFPVSHPDSRSALLINKRGQKWLQGEDLSELKKELPKPLTTGSLTRSPVQAQLVEMDRQSGWARPRQVQFPALPLFFWATLVVFTVYSCSLIIRSAWIVLPHRNARPEFYFECSMHLSIGYNWRVYELSTLYISSFHRSCRIVRRAGSEREFGSNPSSGPQSGRCRKFEDFWPILQVHWGVE